MNLMADRPGSIRRLFSAGASALVLLLTVLAASPELHAWIHGDNSGHDDSGCVISLFSQGVSLAAGGDALVVAPVEWLAAPAPVVTEIFLTAPRYMRQPERGPPVG